MAGTPLDARRDRLGVRRAADLPRAARRPRTTRCSAACMLAGKIEDVLNTVVRQIAFVEFERRVHDARRKRRADRRRARPHLVRGADREPRAGVPLRRRLPDLLELHPALHPRAVLRLRLCLRRLPRELALRGLRGRSPRASRSATSSCCAPAARCATRSCWRRSGSTPPTPASGARGLGMIEGLIDRLEHEMPAAGAAPDRMAEPPAERPENTLPGRVARYARVVGRDGRARGAARGRALPRHRHRSRVARRRAAARRSAASRGR